MILQDSWITIVYRKLMALDIHLNCKSKHPFNVKLGIAVGLIKRNMRIFSDEEISNRVKKNKKTVRFLKSLKIVDLVIRP
jgi:hypothetical protein